jgi:hypothetical protein
MREVYRLNKQPFYDSIKTQKLDVMFICLSQEELSYQDIEKAMLSLMNSLSSIDFSNIKQ